MFNVILKRLKYCRVVRLLASVYGNVCASVCVCVLVLMFITRYVLECIYKVAVALSAAFGLWWRQWQCRQLSFDLVFIVF